ncbi:SCO family protein [Salipaludibacillus aurantiacus]|uniref:Protein SCO1/2 n=1 Tax=Salipaludibacillus aurantiacus TaxID=1601833 RepID=A0A1H9TAB5_9BACI|nr:SCO family protein [Salipaludibacillus aurantiacus]SER94240.1 protein SCO1/2 [Salipaludibacillus aurantiacus]
MSKWWLVPGSLLTLILLSAGCSFLYEDTSESTQGDAVIDVSQAEEPWEIVDFEAVNQYEEDVNNETLQGEWWVTKTIFTRCPTVCMTMTPNMVTLQEGLEDEGIDIRIVSFTVDPEFDTPERLEDYGESYGADFSNWDFLTGYTSEEIREFALESLKAQVQELPEQEDIMHPTRFYLVNPEGVIVRMYSGENNFDLEATVEDIKLVTQAD